MGLTVCETPESTLYFFIVVNTPAKLDPGAWAKIGNAAV